MSEHLSAAQVAVASAQQSLNEIVGRPDANPDLSLFLQRLSQQLTEVANHINNAVEAERLAAQEKPKKKAAPKGKAR